MDRLVISERNKDQRREKPMSDQYPNFFYMEVKINNDQQHKKRCNRERIRYDTIS